MRGPLGGARWACGAVAAHGVLDGEEAAEEVEGREGGVEERGGVEEAGLVEIADGVGGVEGGDGGDVAEGGEAVEGFAEVGLGWAEGGGEIGAEGDGGDHGGLLRRWWVKRGERHGRGEVFGVLRLRCATLRMTGVLRYGTKVLGIRRVAMQERRRVTWLLALSLGGFVAVGELPGGAVAEELLDEGGVHGVAGSLGDDAAPDAAAGEGEVADEVEDLVAHELVGEAEGAVEDGAVVAGWCG